jgi:Poly A polymerase head domain
MDFKLPFPITPRPGEEVIAYQGLSRHEGVFVGYNTSDGLMIRVGQESFITVPNFLQIRPKDPFLRKEPCWKDYFDKKNVLQASNEEKKHLDNLLNEIITPGPTYLEFINEIWSRGYETFLVGGGVRDVLNGEHPKDVDLVTTIPFNILTPIVKSMFGDTGFSRSRINGFMSVGKDASNKKDRSIYDPLIDVKNIFSYAPGTNDAQFGANIDYDYKFRDFACNSIYYEPINSFFVDPSGLGINDAKTKKLSLVNDTSKEHPKYKKANISFRFFKFVKKGYQPTDACVKAINEKIKPLMESLGHSHRIGFFRRYFLNNISEELRAERSVAILEVQEMMVAYGFEDVWEKYYSPHLNELV